MFGTDTAKRDMLLIALGLLAAGFFYWFYPIIHPLNLGDNSLGNQTASNFVDSEMNRLGFTYEDGAQTTYRVNTDILDFVQTELSEQEVEGYDGGSAVRSLIPSFYWHSQRKIQRTESLDEIPDTEESDWLLTVHLSESGQLLAIRNPLNLFPKKGFEAPFFEEYMPELIPQLQPIRPDSLLFEELQFRLTVGQNRNSDTVIEGDPTYLGPDAATEMGFYHLEQSGWPSEYFTASDPEPQVIRGVETARIVYSGELPEILPSTIEVTLDLLPTGTLVAMDYQMQGEVDVLNESGLNVRVGVTVVTIFLLAIWLLILFFVRIRLRLVDIKLSVLIAVLAGFSFPLIFLMRQVNNFAYTYSMFSMEQIFGILLALGFMAASSSIVFFITTAIGDSLTREKWIEKLKTFDLVRLAMFYNRPVGLLIIRSVAYAFMLASLVSLVVFLIPNSYISVTETFRSDATILPSLEVIISSTLFYLVLVQIVLLICIGKLSGRTKRPIWIISLSAVLFLLLNYMPVNFGPWSTDMIAVGVVGVAAGLIYIKEDFLTVFLSLTLMGIHLLSATGWVMDASPDVSVFYVSLLLTIVLVLLGAFGFYNGDPVDELPEYVPDYINELKKDERIKQELQIARAVQQSFLPGKMPNSNGFEIAAICTPAHETGGDYYDFIEMNENQLAVTIGDVSGKGIEAAFYMTFTKGVLHALSDDISSTSEMLIRINNLFLKNAKKGTFISLIFGIIDFKNSTFRFSRGGHNPLLLFNADSGKIKEYRPSGIGLGMANEELFRHHIKESSIQLKKGDILVLFTDGVVEATDARGRFYGDNRLKSILRRSSKLSADKIIHALSEDLLKFGEGSEPHDDMTTIVIKKT
ncbi:SpoIIE family protein phosphatase [Rhodohalobacter sp. 8-1]|uniref:SpoIIE family protein phosphatase n=1 Tax=Rhodohalobacter sp. 8-1 TaxID=3131972 RepID=UPI0030EF49D0